MSLHIGLSWSWLRKLRTHYHATLDPAVLWTPSNDTSRPICSDSLNLMPPVPLYLWTLWRYTNAVIIILLLLWEIWLLRSLHQSLKQHIGQVFFISNTLSFTSKLYTPNMFCWSCKTLVTIHWTHLRVNGISSSSSSRKFIRRPLQGLSGDIQ